MKNKNSGENREAPKMIMKLLQIGKNSGVNVADLGEKKGNSSKNSGQNEHKKSVQNGSVKELNGNFRQPIDVLNQPCVGGDCAENSGQQGELMQPINKGKMVGQFEVGKPPKKVLPAAISTKKKEAILVVKKHVQPELIEPQLQEEMED